MNFVLRATAAAAVLAATALAALSANRDFRFVNHSGQTLWEPYVSPVSDALAGIRTSSAGACSNRAAR